MGKAMMRSIGCGLAILATVLVSDGFAEVLSIYEIQYTTDPGGDSPHAGSIVSCTGGIVTHVFFGRRPRIFIQDPQHATWGAIQVKDWTTGGLLAHAVQPGDWLTLDNVLVEEFKGTTFLQYDPRPDGLSPDASYTIESTGNVLPDPLVLTADAIGVPADHAASEPYEAMLLQVRDVTVTELGLGKAGDNYALADATGVCWASDYMNWDNYGDYHERIELGRRYQSITGLLEQYTSDPWDYYQLLTRGTDDIVIPEPLAVVFLAAGAWWLRPRRTRGAQRS